MSRPRRLTASGVLQHIIARFSRLEPALKREEDFLTLLSLVDRYKRRYQLHLYSYVLLPSHVHLLVAGSLEGTVPRAMRDILTNFTKWYNSRHSRCGSLWESRYRCVVVEDGAPALACMGFLDAHPVKAGVASRVGQYRWSSYGYYARQERDPRLDAYHGYVALAAEPKGRARKYMAIGREVCNQAGECGKVLLTTSAVFGSAEFVQKMARLVGIGQRTLDAGAASDSSSALGNLGTGPRRNIGSASFGKRL